MALRLKHLREPREIAVVKEVAPLSSYPILEIGDAPESIELAAPA